MKINYVAEFTGTGTTRKQPRKVLNESAKHTFTDDDAENYEQIEETLNRRRAYGRSTWENLALPLDWELVLENEFYEVDDRTWNEMYAWMEERANRGDFNIHAWYEYSWDDTVGEPEGGEGGIDDGERERIEGIVREFAQEFGLDRATLESFKDSFNVELSRLENWDYHYREVWEKALDNTRPSY